MRHDEAVHGKRRVAADAHTIQSTKFSDGEHVGVGAVVCGQARWAAYCTVVDKDIDSRSASHATVRGNNIELFPVELVHRVAKVILLAVNTSLEELKLEGGVAPLVVEIVNLDGNLSIRPQCSGIACSSYIFKKMESNVNSLTLRTQHVLKQSWFLTQHVLLNYRDSMIIVLGGATANTTSSTRKQERQKKEERGVGELHVSGAFQQIIWQICVMCVNEK